MSYLAGGLRSFHGARWKWGVAAALCALNGLLAVVGYLAAPRALAGPGRSGTTIAFGLAWFLIGAIFLWRMRHPRVELTVSERGIWTRGLPDAVRWGQIETIEERGLGGSLLLRLSEPLSRAPSLAHRSFWRLREAAARWEIVVRIGGLDVPAERLFTLIRAEHASHSDER